MKRAARFFIHNITGARKYQFNKVAEFAKNKKGLKILEIGSGKKVKDRHSYSAKHLFLNDNEFIQTDIIKDFGHRILDVTKMRDSNKYDVILCMNVLEHVFEYNTAVKNIYNALKKDGTVIIALPMYYPLHDEPADYWRFTEHSLRILLKTFKHIDLSYKGKREFPFCYYIEATK